MAAEQTSRSIAGDAANWEAAFEDETVGFIPLIARARTPNVLRGSAAVVIEKLFARKDDRQNIAKHTAQLNGIVPEDASPADMDDMRDGVIALLRRIKEERKQKAAVHAKRKKVKKGGERRVAIEARKPMVPRWVAMAALGVIAVCGVAAIAVWSGLQKELPPVAPGL